VKKGDDEYWEVYERNGSKAVLGGFVIGYWPDRFKELMTYCTEKLNINPFPR
jgi:hypothetical protein